MPPAAKTKAANNGKPDINLDPDLVWDKFASARAAVKKALVDRDEEVDVVFAALVAREHPLLVGPPGTGKSLLCDSLAAWLDPSCRQFSVLFNKFTTPEEVFGPVSVTGLKNDEYRRITTGRLPEAHVAFADEIFKSSSAILNTMLRVLNERVYENGGPPAPVPLLVCLAASNEWPGEDGEGKELGALFDRFLFRKEVKPVKGKDARRRLVFGARDHRPDFGTNSVTVQEVKLAQKTARGLDWDPVAVERYLSILEELDKQGGVKVGDRRAFKGRDAARAWAWLEGSSVVRPEHLSVLRHVLWNDPQEDPRVVAKIVGHMADPVRARCEELAEHIDEVSKVENIPDRIAKFKAIRTEAGKLAAHPARDELMAEIDTTIKADYDRLVNA